MKSSWHSTRLDDVLQRTRNVNPSLNPEREFIYVDVSGVSKESLRITNTVILKGKDAPSRARKEIVTGDIIFATIRPTLRRVAIVPPELNGQVCSTGYFVFRPKDGLDSQFLFYFLISDAFNKRMQALQRGASYPAVTDRDIRNERISFPDSIDEQRRIVKILDEVLKKSAKTSYNTEQNLSNSRAVFQTALKNAFANGTGSGESLSEICEISSVLIDPREKEYRDLPHVGGANMVSETGTITDLRTAKEEGLKSGKFLFDEHAVLYSKIRPYLKKVARPNFSGLCSADVYPLSPKQGKLNRDYLYYLLLSPVFTAYAIAGSARAGMPKINRDRLFSFRFPFPPLQEQTQIAEKLDSLASASQRLTDIYRGKLARIDELRRSVLYQALTPTP